nr:reverse transcriptase domain-containing protein [Tanacetum cinerariifolium]
MEELCQPSLNGQGGPIASHLDKFLHVTQSIKVNGVTNDALCLYLFPHSLTHHATAWFDRLPRKSINTFEQMAKMFLGKYFPPSMVTKLRNNITNFGQRPDESFFEAWERYKLSIDRCPNHNMLPVNQIDTFYNRLTLRHCDTINAAAGGTFMKRRPEECYDLIENMTAHHNDWDTSAQRIESSSSITSSFDTEIAALKAKMAKINKNLMRVLQVNQQVKAVTLNCETCGGPHSFNECPATVGNTQNVYAAGAYQGNHNPQGNNQRRNQFFQRASHGQNPPPAYQAPGYQAPVHQPQIPQPQVATTNEFTNFIKANNAILKNMQTNMTSLTNSNLELKNMFGQFMKMNTASSSCSRTLPGNIITNPKEEFKGITTHNGTAYQGPTIPTTSSSLPPVVEHKTEATKDTVHPTNNGSTKDVQPPVVQTESPILNSEPIVAPIIEPVVAPVSAPKPNQRPLIPFTDALILMPKFGPTIKNLLTNKDKLSELARTPLNEHCSAVLLKKFPEKLGDAGKFLISCDFPIMAECLALADLGTSINLMPLSVWNKLSLTDLSPTCMTLELTDRLISHPVGVAEDVFFKVEAFHFPADFVVIDFDADPRTSRYSANYNDMTANRIDVIDMACEEYSQEVLDFSDLITSGNPTPYYDPIVSTTSLTLTQFENSDFLLKEVDAFLALEDDPYDELTDKELKQIKADDQVIQTILLGLPEDMYAAVDNFLKYNQKEVDELKTKCLTKIQDPLALMANSNNPYAFLAPHQDQPSFYQNYMQQPMLNPEDITDPTTTMNMALTLIAKAFKLNYSTPTNNNQRISSNLRNRHIAQPGMNMGQDRQMQMVGGNGENQFRQYARQNVGNLNGYNAIQNVENQVVQNAVQNPRVQNIRNQNGLIGVQGNGN